MQKHGGIQGWVRGKAGIDVEYRQSKCEACGQWRSLNELSIQGDKVLCNDCISTAGEEI